MNDVETTRARLDEIRQRLAQVRDARWSHVFDDAGERLIVTRPVIDGNGRRIGEEAPAVLCVFDVDATWQEKEFVREARDDMAFVLEQLRIAGRMIRDFRSASRAAPQPSAAGPEAARATTRDGRSPLRPSGDDSSSKDYSAEASMKCAEARFQVWLKQTHGTDDDGDMTDTAAAAAVLRRALAIESRKQLNTDRQAAQRWRDMRADYLAWEQS